MAAIQNSIQYAGFSFPFCTLNVQSGVLYAEDGMTKVGVRYIFDVSGWVGGTTQNDLASTIQQMQAALREPRQDFKVTWAGDGTNTFFHSFYEADDTSNGNDLDWGPKPGDLDIWRFSGGRAAMYRWTCTCNVMDANLATDVLAITWQFIHRVDGSGFSTRTVTGKLLLASSIVAAGQSADHYRSVIASALPALTWFRFEGAEYAQSEDGRVLTFTITEKEQYWTMPYPITDGHVTWMSRLSGLGGPNRLQVDYVLSGWFESSAAHTKFEVLQAIFNLAAVKFGAIQGTVIPDDRIIREDVYGRNRVDFSIAAHSPGGAFLAGANNVDYTVGLATFGMQPPNSDGRPIKINPYGQTDSLTSGSVGFAPIPYDATSANVTQNGGYSFANQQQPPNTIDYTDSQRQPPGGTSLANNMKGVSGEAQVYPIVMFHEKISYYTDNNYAYLAPKVANKDPFIQQTAAPKLTVIQAGYMKQFAKSAANLLGPNPPLNDEEFSVGGPYTMLNSYIDVSEPEPISDGTWNLYTTEWRYVMVRNTQVQDGGSRVWVPFDPRRPGDPGNAEIYPPDALPAVIDLPS